MTNSLKLVLLALIIPACYFGLAFSINRSLPQRIVIQVLNPDGTPAEGVQVGQKFHHWNNDQTSNNRPYFHFRGDHSNNSDALLTNAAGQVEVTRRRLFYTDDSRTRVVIATSADRKLMGIVSISPERNTSFITIQLQQTTTVEITPRSPELATLGQEMESAVLHFNFSDFPIHTSILDTEGYSLKLPPGEYTGRIFSRQILGTRFDVLIQPGEELIQKTVNLNASTIEQLRGKPAPEFREIKDWYGSKPITLESLKGKVVILDFWGYWCGPCVYRMPKLFGLYERYHEDGLVIVGIHDDSIGNATELDQKLKPIRENLWEGRDIPFPIAIDGGGEQTISGYDKTVRGATTAAYGIWSWPTYVLIDKEGNVRGKFYPGSEEGHQLLLDLLETSKN